jgi:protein-S-isoprenylcysteine O-methyltransferase Ste14
LPLTLIPAFEIGLWNAWILTLFMFLHALILSLVFGGKSKEHQDEVPRNQSEQKIDTSRTLLLYLMFTYSLFLPLQLNLPWLYIGLGIYLIGILTYKIVMVNWFISPEGKPVSTGIYRFSRHPQYLIQSLIFIGIGIVTASWLFLSIIATYMILLNILVTTEERFCLDKYSDTYREYMRKTPKWIGMPKV